MGSVTPRSRHLAGQRHLAAQGLQGVDLAVEVAPLGLEAIDLLLERRAELRRAERLRAEARELDDLAGQRWLRDRADDRAGDAGGEA